MSSDKENDKHEKPITIVVNGTEHPAPNDVVAFEQVVEIAFPGHPTNPDVVFSVTFEKADSKPHQGTLAVGGKTAFGGYVRLLDRSPRLRRLNRRVAARMATWILVGRKGDDDPPVCAFFDLRPSEPR